MSYYEKNFEVSTSAGSSLGDDGFLFALPFLHRGELNRLIVRQTSGTLDGFQVDAFSKEAAGPSDRIMPTRSAAALAAAVELFDVRYGFWNRDGTPSIPTRKFYLRIEPAGDPDKDFEVVLGAETNVYVG